jgi:hypothetical protein
VLKQSERAPGLGLALEDVDGHPRRVPDLDGIAVARLDQDDAIEPIDDDDGRVFRDGIDRIADGEDESLLVGIGDHSAVAEYGGCATEQR